MTQELEVKQVLKKSRHNLTKGLKVKTNVKAGDNSDFDSAAPPSFGGESSGDNENSASGNPW